MARASIAALADRGVVCVEGSDATKYLQGLITNDIDTIAAAETGALHAALLTPQGKIIVDFIAAKTAAGFLLDVALDLAPALVKRLSMYKLRADVVIKDVSAEFVVLALWGGDAVSSGETVGTTSFIDPRAAELGIRILAESSFAADIASATNGFDTTSDAYHAHRIALGVPEGGKDYDFADAYPHEANFDLFNGVSFSKGCYVGQEVVARMQNKTVVRKRVVKVSGQGLLARGTDILMGEIPIGRIGSVAGSTALAVLRLDRAVEAIDKNIALTANGITLTPDAASIERYRASLAARPSAPAF